MKGADEIALRPSVRRESTRLGDDASRERPRRVAQFSYRRRRGLRGRLGFRRLESRRLGGARDGGAEEERRRRRREKIRRVGERRGVPRRVRRPSQRREHRLGNGAHGRPYPRSEFSGSRAERLRPKRGARRGAKRLARSHRGGDGGANRLERRARARQRTGRFRESTNESREVLRESRRVARRRVRIDAEPNARRATIRRGRRRELRRRDERRVYRRRIVRERVKRTRRTRRPGRVRLRVRLERRTPRAFARRDEARRKRRRRRLARRDSRRGPDGGRLSVRRVAVLPLKRGELENVPRVVGAPATRRVFVVVVRAPRGASLERGERGGVRANHHRHRRRRGSSRGDSRRVDRRRGPRPDARITPRRYFHRANRREARVVLGRRPRDEVPRAKRVHGGATRLPSDDVREEVRRVGRDATQKRRRAVRPVVRVVVRFRRASRGGRGRERGAHRGDDGEVRGFVRGLSRRRLEHVHRRRGRYPRRIPSDVAAAPDEFGDAPSGERDDGVVRSTDIVQRRRERFRSTREGLRARRGTHARRRNRQRLPRRAKCVSGRVARIVRRVFVLAHSSLTLGERVPRRRRPLVHRLGGFFRDAFDEPTTRRRLAVTRGNVTADAPPTLEESPRDASNLARGVREES